MIQNLGEEAIIFAWNQEVQSQYTGIWRGNPSDLASIPRAVPQWITLTKIDLFHSPLNRRKQVMLKGPFFPFHDNPSIPSLADKCFSTNQSVGPMDPLDKYHLIAGESIKNM